MGLRCATAAPDGSRAPPADDDRSWLRAAVAIDAHIEARVVCDHCPDSDEHRIVVCPELVSVGAGLRSGDPLRGPVGGGRLTIERRGELQRHEWPTGRPVMEVARVVCDHGRFFYPGDDLDACLAKLGDAPTGDPLGRDQALRRQHARCRRRSPLGRMAAFGRDGCTVRA